MVWTCALCLQEMEKCQVPGLFWQSGEMLRYPEIKKNTTIPAALILKLRLAENFVWNNKAVHWRVCPLSAVDSLLVENCPPSSHQGGPTTPHIIQSWSSNNFPSPFQPACVLTFTNVCLVGANQCWSNYQLHRSTGKPNYLLFDLHTGRPPAPRITRPF